jgi:hypothetical protein
MPTGRNEADGKGRKMIVLTVQFWTDRLQLSAPLWRTPSLTFDPVA